MDETHRRPRAMFEHSFYVPDDDIDSLGHVSNIAYVRWIQEVAVAHSEAVGLDRNAYQQMGAVFVIRRHEVDYLRPVLRGERIEARTWIDTFMAAKCVRMTELRRDGVVVAQARTTWGFVDLRTGRPTRVPPEVRAAFGFGASVVGEALGADPNVEVVQRTATRAE